MIEFSKLQGHVAPSMLIIRLLPHAPPFYPSTITIARNTRTPFIRPRSERIYSLLDIYHPPLLPTSTSRRSTPPCPNNLLPIKVATSKKIHHSDQEAQNLGRNHQRHRNHQIYRCPRSILDFPNSLRTGESLSSPIGRCDRYASSARLPPVPPAN